ncbi:MAG: DNA polymerase I [Nitrosomonadales bacterium]|jgi:DNA polymerase-1|nr:DNA polymerase I [Nitrosomonadales bacterium]
MKTLLLIDGSSYLYRAFHAMPDFRNKTGFPTGVIYGVLNMLQNTHKKYESSYSVCVFDAKGKTFRNDIYSEYKANRPKMPDDLSIQIAPLHKAIKAMGWPIYIKEGVEADDVIGTLAKKANEENISVTISTGDKDLAQLVNNKTALVNTMTNEYLDIEGVKSKFGVGPDLIIDYLTIIGDKADNIPGVEKVGPKTALKWLNEFNSLDNIIKNSEKISGAVGENLKSALDWLPIAKDLISIRSELDIEVSWDQFKKSPEDKNALKKMYQEFNFSSWLKNIDSKEIDISQEAPDQNVDTEFNNQKNYMLIQNTTDLKKWINQIKKEKLFSIDTETTSLEVMNAKLVGISISLKKGEAAYIPVNHMGAAENEQINEDEVIDLFKPILEDGSITKIGQNIKYDAHIFLNLGIKMHGINEDTMLMSYVINSNESHGMNKLSQKYLGHECISYESLVGSGVKQLSFDQININDALDYAAEDADVTFQLYHVLKDQLKKEKKLLAIYEKFEIPSMKTLIEIERNGVLIDASLLNQQSQKIGEELINIENKAFELAGQPFNLASPKQLREILFEKLQIKPLKKTPTGTPSTSEEVLQELAKDYPLPKILLEYRTLAKLKSTYTDKLPLMINQSTGRIHTSYNQAVAVTGRLASSDPNLQNIPIKSPEGRKIREAFIAKPDFSILSADYSQIELRILAHLSKDSGLIQAFKDNKDIHTITASEIFNTKIEKITSEQRRYAKIINFGLIYGMGAFGLAKNLNITRGDAQNYIQEYFNKYPTVLQYMEESKQFAREHGYVETYFGRRLWLPEINSSNGLRKAGAERAAINAPMQGTAADLIKLAMIEVQQWIHANSNLKGQMIMQVHDELVFEVPNTEVDIFIKEIPQIMQNVAKLDIPLTVEINAGKNWEEAH